ncbi:MULTISPECIES: hypothetical protein [Salinibaculum]|uniref:hypothetical protein n=1 Tax=Salinibaculum TaxID=2732368 RepID=UPI0030D51969
MTDADDVEWLSGPTPASDNPDGTQFIEDSPDGTTILDEETDLRSFLGVVNDDAGPWGVAVHIARVEHAHDGGTDVAVAAGVHSWPVVSTDGFEAGGKQFTDIVGGYRWW